MKLIDVLAPYRNFKRLDGEYGIEIETESKKPYDPPKFMFWTTHGDNSLRDFGIEYVLKQPVTFKEVPTALSEFRDKTKEITFIPDSFSTSVHVHINMLNEDLKTLGNFMTLYTLFENLLIRFSGPTRLSNLFCLPICDATDINTQAASMLRGMELRNFKSLVLSENAVKYAALNLSALGKYGSLEVRSFRGETDIDKIQEWVSILHKILTYARQEDINPRIIMDIYRKAGFDFTKEVFGKELTKALHHPDEASLVEQNLFFAGQLAYSVKDWKAVDVEDAKFKPTQRQLNDMSYTIFGKKEYSDLTAGEQAYVREFLQKDWERNRFNKPTRSKKKNPLEIAMNQVEFGNPFAANNPANEVPPHPVAALQVNGDL